MPDNRIRLEKYSQPDNRAKPGTTCDESNAHWKISKCQEKKILFFFFKYTPAHVGFGAVDSLNAY